MPHVHNNDARNPHPSRRPLPKVSVVLPCLNEEEGIGLCINKIKKAFRAKNIDGEIVVVDNGCTDRTAEIAHSMGAQVIREEKKGYGYAYQKGFAVANGKYLVMGDADNTYDFSLIPEFIHELEHKKYEFVTGSRYMTEIESKRMPLLHKFIGNPLLTRILNWFFGSRYTDVYCGFRAFSRKAYHKIHPISPGMEYNLELAINAHLAQLRTTEIPIKLGSRAGESKLRTFRDGWRSLRMMLLYCPNKVFFLPGIVLTALGFLLHALVLAHQVQIDGRPAGIVSSLFATIFSVVGIQILSLGLHAKTYSWSQRFNANTQFIQKFYQYFKLETGLLFGGVLVLLGTGILGFIVYYWLNSNLLPLPFPEWVSFAATNLIIGIAVIFTSLFISAMTMGKQNE